MHALWEEIWPNTDGLGIEERVEAFFLGSCPEHRAEAGSERFHVLEGENRLMGVAWTYVRKIHFAALQREEPVLALAGVCSSPCDRGRGFGRQIVLDAFSRLCDETPWCLFQTGVPEFYKRLGAFTAENEFVNRYAEDPQVNPWWEKSVMAYGFSRKWPEGRVDLCGVGY
ncbi:hypothetical protein QEH53_02755 [Pelagicoccus sp. SDUM812002]|nr:hypothetical protein [Pelagicoccus sp. SDUM812002]